jgi:hypothetical protein
MRSSTSDALEALDLARDIEAMAGELALRVIEGLNLPDDEGVEGLAPVLQKLADLVAYVGGTKSEPRPIEDALELGFGRVSVL